MPDANAVDQVSDDTSENQSERNLSGGRVDIKVVPGPNEDHQRCESDEGERPVVAAEHAPGCAGIAPVNEFEKTVENYFFLGVAEVLQNKELC